jgi:glycosyltransferase involved in cell wall biosynthesis
MGNNAVHAYIYKQMMKTPGVVVLHEFVLHHLRLGMLQGWTKGRAYRREMTRVYGEAGRKVADNVRMGRNLESMFEFPLVEEAIRRAKGIIVHSEYMAGRVREVRPEAPLAVVPMGVPLPPYIARLEARARLGLAPDLFIVSSLGHLNPYKRLKIALSAFKTFSLHVPRVQMLLVGSQSPNFDVNRLIRMLGLGEHVPVIGFAPQAQVMDYVAASDICINLRYPTAGETSAALLRIMGAGKPVLVSDVGYFGELPDAAVAKVDIGPLEHQLLLEYFLLLHSNVPVRLAMGRAARQYVATHHTLEGAAAGYMRFLARLQGRELPASFEMPIFGAEDWPERELAATLAVESQPAPPKTGRDLRSETSLEILADAAADLDLAPDDPSLAGLVDGLKGLL